jgi:glycosyltransferase involved in cell wall biosynthesis
LPTEPSGKNEVAMGYTDLTIVIPAFNEAEGIKATLDGLTAMLQGAEIIVVDDASTDATSEIVLRYFPQVTLVQHIFNRGYGDSLKTGMSLAKNEYVAWFDADNEHRSDHLIEMYKKIRTLKLAAVIGQREKPGISSIRNWGKFIIRMLAKSLNYKGGPDMNCGLRIFRTDVIAQYIPVLPNAYSASITSTLLMLERGYPTQFHPIEVNPRLGQSKVRLTDGFMSLVLVLRIIMLIAPMRIFLGLGLLFLASGLGYGFVVAILKQQGFPMFAGLFSMLGLVLVILGLIADQVSQMRLSSLDKAQFIIINRPL